MMIRAWAVIQKHLGKRVSKIILLVFLNTFFNPIICFRYKKFHDILFAGFEGMICSFYFYQLASGSEEQTIRSISRWQIHLLFPAKKASVIFTSFKCSALSIEGLPGGCKGKP